MADTKKKAKKMLSSFTILFIILLVVALASVIVSIVAPESGVKPATLSSFTMAPVGGFANALDVCVFVMVLGGFLAIMTKTGALDTGIQVLVRSLHGKELWLIPVLMTIFSIGGTTYGMCERRCRSICCWRPPCSRPGSTAGGRGHRAAGRRRGLPGLYGKPVCCGRVHRLAHQHRH
ncbi:MAG: hypothetical protein ACLRPX_03880 [Ruthenibacterium sp.]